jgi:hypothetical protein
MESDESGLYWALVIGLALVLYLRSRIAKRKGAGK